MKQPLSSVCEIIMGQAPSGETYNEQRIGLPLIAGASDFGALYPNPSRFTTAAAKISRAHDIVLCVRATIGELNWSDGEYCLGRGVAALRINEQKADRRYIWRAVEHGADRLSALGRGATFKQISKADIADFEISVPPLEEQKRIAVILDQADELRRLRKRAIDRLNDLRQAIFYEMFGDPSINPFGWPIGTIDDLTESTQYGTSDKAGPDGDLPILRMGNITTSGHFDFRDLKYIDLSSKEIEKYTIRDGDILFNRTNSPDLVGKTAVYRGHEIFAYAGYLVRLRTNHKATPEYISAYLNNPFGKKVLRSMCKAIIGMANINARELRTIPIPIVPYELQQIFQRRVMACDSATPVLRRHAQYVETLFSSVQSRAFRGGV